jgi:hypothetical protein
MGKGGGVVLLGTTLLNELRTVNCKMLLLTLGVLSEAEVDEKNMHTRSRWRRIF